MRMDVKTSGLEEATRKLVMQLRNRAAFVKNWANSAAMEGRENARRKPGRRWWRDLARSVQVRGVGQEAAEVSSSQVGANLKQYGGTIVPRRRNSLTIPIAPEARGKRAYELERVDRPLFRLPGTRLLGYSQGKGKQAKFKALFVLSKRVVQSPDPWFPDNGRIALLARREASALFSKENKQWHS